MRSTLTILLNRDLLAEFNSSCSSNGEFAAAVIRDSIIQFNRNNALVEVASASRKPRPMHYIDDQAKLTINIDASERARFRSLLSSNGNSVSEVIRSWIEKYIQGSVHA